jgi:hypothetical protein
VYDYYQRSYEARERINRREREAQAERIVRYARARRQRRRRAQLAAALELLIPARQRAARLRQEA